MNESLLGHLQGLFDIVDQVIKILDTDGNTDQVFCDSQLLSYFLRDVCVSHQSRDLSQAFNSSQGLSQSDDLAVLQELGGLLFSSLDSDAEHATESSHLLLGDFVVLVGLETGVNNLINMRMLLQVVSNVISTSGGSSDSYFECFETSEDEVAVERTGIGSDAAGSEKYFFVEL